MNRSTTQSSFHLDSNQPINGSINHATIQLKPHPLKLLLMTSINQPFHESINQTSCQLLIHPIKLSRTTSSINHSVNRSIIQRFINPFRSNIPSCERVASISYHICLPNQTIPLCLENRTYKSQTYVSQSILAPKARSLAPPIAPLLLLIVPLLIVLQPTYEELYKK